MSSSLGRFGAFFCTVSWPDCLTGFLAPFNSAGADGGDPLALCLDDMATEDLRELLRAGRCWLGRWWVLLEALFLAASEHVGIFFSDKLRTSHTNSYSKFFVYSFPSLRPPLPNTTLQLATKSIETSKSERRVFFPNDKSALRNFKSSEIIAFYELAAAASASSNLALGLKSCLKNTGQRSFRKCYLFFISLLLLL